LIRLLELHGGDELETGFFQASLLEVDHAQIVADFLVGRRKPGCTLQVHQGLFVVVAPRGQLPQAMFAFGGQATTEQAAVQGLGLALSQHAVDLGLAQTHCRKVIRQALQVGQASMQFAAVDQFVRQAE